MNESRFRGNPSDRWVKVVVELPDEGDGYPPVSSESLWGTRLADGGHEVRLGNIPFYALGVSNEDVVWVEENDRGELIYQRVVTPSGNSTFQLFVKDVADVQRVRDELRAMGCPSELSDIPQFIAVEIPPSVAIGPFLDYIMAGQDEGRLDYQEAALRHPLPE